MHPKLNYIKTLKQRDSKPKMLNQRYFTDLKVCLTNIICTSKFQLALLLKY